MLALWISDYYFYSIHQWLISLSVLSISLKLVQTLWLTLINKCWSLRMFQNTAYKIIFSWKYVPMKKFPIMNLPPYIWNCSRAPRWHSMFFYDLIIIIYLFYQHNAQYSNTYNYTICFIHIVTISFSNVMVSTDGSLSHCLMIGGVR